ncbi:efflux RND transporter periplasmic adaptor subunit [Sulfurimonas sp. HSL-1716]|uniref:efflux RND transporter periplasmic adaptor subunit n=1 Tax=Hydrocurvibacter sulfurireducens TaxID=3131937 RepID=UPI0031F82E5C
MKKILLSLMILFSALNAEGIYATFDVKADKSASLAFYASGIVEKVYVDVSSYVKKGDKLAELQNSDLQASLEMAKSSLEDARVNLAFTLRDYERQKKIKKLIDEALFDKYKLAYERAKAVFAEAQANVAYKKALLDNTVLYAPFDGVIFNKDIEAGDVVSSMTLKTVFNIQSRSKRKLIVEFDQTHWKEVKVGDLFRYKVDGDTKEYTGKISKIYPSANNSNRKIKAEVRADDFIVGLFGDGYIQTDKK